jgi:asparagine synthase (glutamine-hydrolysing)
MCGFAGLLKASPDNSKRLRDNVRGMADVLAHRGPDDSGEWTEPNGHLALAFRRLAIVDLSPAGAQPMRSPSGRYTMVFNGEVYNFEALRRELGNNGFRGHSDTEVVLYAFERWGVRPALERFVGMFALALWDAGEQRLTLARDRMGIKPLYVGRIPGGVAFASELRAIEAAPGFRPQLDLCGLQQYLQYLYVPAPRTPYAAVQKLPPGHLLELEPSRSGEPLPASEAWWSLENARSSGQALHDSDISDAERVDALEALLLDAVRLRMIADVPLGALLSGGIDSSLVVALMQQQSQHPVRTFSIGFDDPAHDETEHARAVASHLGTRHTELGITGSDALELVPRMPEIFDEPLADPSLIPTYLVSRLAREHVTVALSGDGGDELFAGYARYSAGLRILQPFSQIPRAPRRLIGRALRSLPTAQVNRWAPRLPGPLGRLRLPGSRVKKLGRMLASDDATAMYRSLLCTEIDLDVLRDGGVENDGDPIRAMLSRCNSLNGIPALSDMLHADQRYYLPDDLLQKVDRASMAISLEVRVPLLDHRVVECSWQLADHHKLRGGTGKWILRRILDRHVPRALIDRPKTGFTVPLERWLTGPLSEWAEELLFSPDPMRDELLRAEPLRGSWDRLNRGYGEEALGIWAILNLVAWCRDRDIQDLTVGEIA